MPLRSPHTILAAFVAVLVSRQLQQAAAHDGSGSNVGTPSCTITDFHAAGPHQDSVEQCGLSGCTYYMESRYTDCAEFCTANGLFCDAAWSVTSTEGDAGCDASQKERISCYGDGFWSDQFERICSCKGVCRPTDFEAVGANTASPEQCDDSTCRWYLETQYSDCDDFCSDNGLLCTDARRTDYGAGCYNHFGLNCGLEDANEPTDAPTECSGDMGVSSSQFPRRCECGCDDWNCRVLLHDACPTDDAHIDDMCGCTKSKAASVRCCAFDDEDPVPCQAFCEEEKVTFDEARKICADNGKRLCTSAELDTGVCCNTPPMASNGERCECDVRVWTEENAPCARTCDITDFSVVGRNQKEPELCSYEDPAPTAEDVRGCTYLLQTEYADCDTFCHDNGLECVAATALIPSGDLAMSCERRGMETEISCSGDGADSAAFYRTCTCSHCKLGDRPPLTTRTPTSPPTAAPTPIATDVPTPNPTPEVTAIPTVIPDDPADPTPSPTAYPTNTPTAISTAVPTNTPTADPTAYPTNTPTANPTAVPTNTPTANPTAVPTRTPTADPTAYPTADPTAVPTNTPTADPTTVPTRTPTADPTAYPTADPTAYPTADPTAYPTADPTAYPTADPTAVPTNTPTADPTAVPTNTPTVDPTAVPTRTPTAYPTADPTAVPTRTPTAYPTADPTAYPTADPTAYPTANPTAYPTAEPTAYPTADPTAYPTADPTVVPTNTPTADPTNTPTADPTAVPTRTPTADPTAYPTNTPTADPTAYPTNTPTADPTAYPTNTPTANPTAVPTRAPTADPTAYPTNTPTANPTAVPTRTPTADPTAVPTRTPTADPTAYPSNTPTANPTAVPTRTPTADPTAYPTADPTAYPTADPTAYPTADPTAYPTADPTAYPTAVPTSTPTANPTAYPTADPTAYPTNIPTANPTAYPTADPTAYPTNTPTANPTAYPTNTPTANPTAYPTNIPTANPTAYPTNTPTANPTNTPTANPTNAPTANPTPQPTNIPTAVPTAYPTDFPTIDDPTADVDCGNCLAILDTGGCDSDEVEACVCARDPYCCFVEWDRRCVETVFDPEPQACGIVCDEDPPACHDEPDIDNAKPTECAGTLSGEYCSPIKCLGGFVRWGGSKAKCLYGSWVEQPRCTPPAGGFGDVHFTSLDGLLFAYHKTGIIRMWESPRNNMELQIRTLRPASITCEATLISQVALRADDQRITAVIGSTGSFDIRFNDELQSLEAGVEYNLGSGPDALIVDYTANALSIVSKRGALLNVLYNAGETMSWLVVPHSLDPETFAGTTAGLLGNFNGDPLDDLTLRDGSQLTVTTLNTTNGVQTAYGNSWLLDEDESLFGDAEDAVAASDPQYEGAPPDSDDDVECPSDFSEYSVPECDALAPELVDGCYFDVIVGGDVFLDDILYQPVCGNNTDQFCSFHGKCVDNACECTDGWAGPNCEDRVCPQACVNSAGSVGDCRPDGVCDCLTGFTGAACDEPADCAALNDCHASAGYGACVDDGVCECNNPSFAQPDCAAPTPTAIPTPNPSPVPTPTPTAPSGLALQATNVCFSAQQSQPSARFKATFTGSIAGAELRYVSGGVQCDSTTAVTRWGCVDDANFGRTLGVIVQSSSFSSYLFPAFDDPRGFDSSPARRLYLIPGVDPDDLVLELRAGLFAATVTEGEEYELFYSEVVDGSSVDNNLGVTCADVYFDRV